MFTIDLLLRSVAEWNDARKAHPEREIDLHDEALPMQLFVALTSVKETLMVQISAR